MGGSVDTSLRALLAATPRGGSRGARTATRCYREGERGAGLDDRGTRQDRRGRRTTDRGVAAGRVAAPVHDDLGGADRRQPVRAVLPGPRRCLVPGGAAAPR